MQADLDQDGKPDAVVIDGTSGLLSLFVNDGTGTFSNAPYTFQLPVDSYQLAIADLNQDGLPDVVVSSKDAKTLTLILSSKILTVPTLSLTTPASSVLVGTSLALTATVTGGTKTPTGTVSLLDGSSKIAQQALGSSGSVVFNLANLSAGVHALSFSYAGDNNFAAQTSPSINESVTDFMTVISPSSQTVAAGASASYTVTITPVAGFTGAVVLTCSGLPSLATCNAVTSNVGGGPATATITVSTTAATTAALRTKRRAAYACLLFGCITLGLLRRRSALAAKESLLLFPISILLLSGALSACGGGSKTTGPVAPVQPGTPAGSSTISITAAATQNGVSVTHVVTGTLVVQ